MILTRLNSSYPNKNAALVVLDTVRAFLEANHAQVITRYCFDRLLEAIVKGFSLDFKFDRVIFCLFLDVDADLYEKYLNFFFPIDREAKTTKQQAESIAKEEKGPGETDQSKAEPKDVDQHLTKPTETKDEAKTVPTGEDSDNREQDGQAKEATSDDTTDKKQAKSDQSKEEAETEAQEAKKLKPSLKKDQSISSHLRDTTIE